MLAIFPDGLDFSGFSMHANNQEGFNKMQMAGLHSLKLWLSGCQVGSRSFICTKCFGLNYVAQNSYVDVLIPNMAVFEIGLLGDN